MAKIVQMKRAVPQTNRELPIVDGCIYVTGIGHKGKVPFKIFCHKIVEPDSEYCPKHRLFVEDEGKEPQRRREARRAKREYEQAENTALALSPLKAHNPNFDDVIENTGYQPEPRKR